MIHWRDRRPGPLARAATVALGVGVLGVIPRTAPAQGAELNRVVERARTTLVSHDVAGLVGASDTVRLQIPGVAASTALRPGQAARLLERYLRDAEEQKVLLVEVRRLAEDHAYAELERHYVVRGTVEERQERVFLGFRRQGGVWRLEEVRVTP